MTWCCQATSHNMGQCWSRSVSTYVVTRPQRVNTPRLKQSVDIFESIFNISFFFSNFIEVCSKGSNWQTVNVASSNGLAPNRQQAITWTNYNLNLWRFLTSLGQDELKVWFQNMWGCRCMNMICNQLSSMFYVNNASHYLNQYRPIDNWTQRNKLQWNIYQNTNILFQNNAHKCRLANKYIKNEN